MDKYEYLTGEDLGLKPSTIEQTKFEYSPLSKIFNTGLSENDKKEGLFKRLENIKDTNLTQLQATKNIDISSKPLKTIGFFSTLSDKAKKLMVNIKQLDDWFDTAQLICTKTDRKTKHNFSSFTFPSKFASKIYNKNVTLQKAKDDQQELKILINMLNYDYNPQNIEKIKEKDNTLESAKKSFFIREEIIKAFETDIFPYVDDLQMKNQMKMKK